MDIIDVGGARRFSTDKPTRFGVLDRPRVVCDLICLEPGQQESRREHPASDELYYVIEGAAVVRVGLHEYPVSAQQALLVPPGIPHWIGNAGPGRLTALAVVTPKPGRDAELAPRRPAPGARDAGAFRGTRDRTREERQPEWPRRTGPRPPFPARTPREGRPRVRGEEPAGGEARPRGRPAPGGRTSEGGRGPARGGGGGTAGPRTGPPRPQAGPARGRPRGGAGPSRGTGQPRPARGRGGPPGPRGRGTGSPSSRPPDRRPRDTGRRQA